MATYTCCVCRDRFEPEPHNKHHQRYCSKPSCQAERQRLKRKNYYHRKAKSQAFRLSEAERQRQRRLSKKKAPLHEPGAAVAAPAAMPPPVPAAQPSPFNLSVVDLVLGIISQISASASLPELTPICMRLAEKGRHFRGAELPGQSPPGYPAGRSPPSPG
ncbi:MAG: hypothetical protein ACOX6W_05175 [Lentisphaeria bacterium]|jgi:hypothetical protein